VHLAALYLYPVKSCRGLAVTAAEVDERGLVGDRRFMVVDAHGQFLTQRAHPRMALIETTLTADALVLSSPNHRAVAIPRSPALGPRPSTLRVTVWKDTVTADDCGGEPAGWLSEFLGFPCRLVRTGASYARPIPARKLPATFDRRLPARHEVSFADGFPFLVISEASLDDLNSRLAPPLPMHRFRPNLVIAGCAPHAEDTLGRFRLGGLIFHGATRCTRCAITTTDQFTAERGKEPLATLATYRRDAAGAVEFGRNLVHETKSGTLRVGDRLDLL
jgi:uncharacterized protein YcbX